MMINDNHDKSNEQPSNSSSFSPLPLFFKEKKNRFKAFIHRIKNSKDLTNSSRRWNQILVDNRSTHNFIYKILAQTLGPMFIPSRSFNILVGNNEIMVCSNLCL